MSMITKLGIALTAVFAVSLGALVAQIAWVLWRRNRFLRNDHGSGRGDIEEGDVSGGYFIEPLKATRELLYFFCCRKDSQPLTRVEPDGGRGAMMGDDDEVMKWHAMYREPRMLCTIKEEEKEGESDRDGDGSGGGGGGGLATLESDKKKERRVCLRECLETKQESLDRETAVVIVRALDELSEPELTAFSTPCGSPDRYFTPSPSPARVELDKADANYAEMAAHC